MTWRGGSRPGASEEQIPWIECKAREAKYVLARELRPKDPNFRGVFAVLVGRAPAPVWEVRHNQAGNCFVEGTDYGAVNGLAELLTEARMPQELQALCERWLGATGRGRAGAHPLECGAVFGEARGV